MLAIKLCLLALTACTLTLLIKAKNPQGAMLLSLTACCVLLMQLLPQLQSILQYCQALAQQIGLEPSSFQPLLKAVTLSICIRITAELCRDAGERALAAKVEIAGAASGILCAVPLLQQALAIIGAL